MKGGGSVKKEGPKSRGKTNKTCFYCKKPGHFISECEALKDKEQREGKGKRPMENQASLVDSEYDGDVLMATSSLLLAEESSELWVLDFGCTFHMCHHKSWFDTYEEVNGGVVHLGNNTECEIMGIGSVKIKTHNGMIRTLSGVRHIPLLKRNLVSLGALEGNGCKFLGRRGTLQISVGSMVVMKGVRRRNLYTLLGSTVAHGAIEDDVVTCVGRVTQGASKEVESLERVQKTTAGNHVKC